MDELFKRLPNYADIQGLHLFNGAIANSNRIYLIGRIYEEDKVDSKIHKKVLMFQRDNPAETQLQVVTILPLGYKTIQCEMHYAPEEHCVLYSTGGQKCSIYGNRVQDESERFACSLPRLISNKLHVAAYARRVLVRDDHNTFQELGAKQTYSDYENHDRPADEDGVDAMLLEDGFHDVDGFDENHIYAAGGKGDVWRYVDGVWTQCEFPSNLKLKNVCCGEDGLVYISGLEGMTYVGKEDSWKALPNPELIMSFENVAWYDGKVWATNDHSTWWITPDGIVKADLPSDVEECSGRLHVNAGMLLLVGWGGACLLENGEWQILFHYSEYTERYLP